MATLIALLHRQRTGRGQHVEVAQIEAISPFIGADLLRWQIEGTARARLGNGSDRMAPHGCYPTSGDDRWVVIAVQNDDEWADFCSVPGHHEWATDERFSSMARRVAHREALDQLIASWSSSRDRYEIMHMLQRSGIAAGPVLSGKDLRSEPQLRSGGFYQAIDRRHVGTHEYPLVPIRLARAPRREATAAPSLGEHNEQVLGGLLGLSEAELGALEARGVIGTRPRARS